MREPKHYQDRHGRHYVVWYGPGRKTKGFTDPIAAELLYQEKLLGHPVDKEAMILKEVATIKRYVVGGRLQELEKENAEKDESIAQLKNELEGIRDELAAARARSAGATETRKPEEASNSGRRSDVRLFRPDIAVRLGVPAAVILQQLCWLIRQEKCGKVLADGKRYIFNTYLNWRSTFFPFYSVQTLERNFKILEGKGLVASKQPEGRASRRKWYTLTAEGIKLMDSVKNEGAKSHSGVHQIDELRNASNRSIPSSKSETSTDVVVRDESKDCRELRQAAAAAISLALIEKLQGRYPLHDVATEFDRYLKHRRSIGKPPISSGFEKWLERAEVPLVRPKRTVATIPPPLDDAPPESDPDQLNRFMNERARRRTRAKLNESSFSDCNPKVGLLGGSGTLSQPNLSN